MRTDTFTTYLEDLGATIEDGVVRRFGDIEAEYRAIVDGTIAIADRSERETVVATGAEVVELMQGLVTNDVFKLAKAGTGQLNTAVNVKGRFVSDLRLLHVPELLVIDLEPGRVEAGAIVQFKRNIINEDARFADRSKETARVLLIGDGVLDLLMATLKEPGRPFVGIGEWDATWGRIAGAEVIAQRIPTYGYDAFELYIDRNHQAAAWEALTAQKDLVPVGADVLETLRIETGQPRFGVELDEKIIPLEADMNHAVAYDKGCYLGQEIIARLDTLGTPAKMLRKLLLDGEAIPEVGAEIQVDGKKVGDVRCAVYSPRFGAPLALGYVKRKFNEPGSIVEVLIDDRPVRATLYALQAAPEAPEPSRSTG